MPKKLYLELIQNNPSYSYEEIQPVNTQDVDSDMLHWDKATFIMDWSRRRDKIAVLFYQITGPDFAGYANLTSEQKNIGARYFLVPKELRVGNGIFTNEQDKENWRFLLVETKNSRAACVEEMRLRSADWIREGLLTKAQTQQFLKDVKQFIDWFIDSNAPDFKQMLSSEPLTPYEFTGFKTKSYWSQSLEDELMSIYNGNY